MWAISNLNWDIQHLWDSQPRVNLRPEYQRNLVWDRATQQRLIWCVLRGQDVPKFYFHFRDDLDPSRWDVVDGQQRIDAIWRFIDNGYPLATKAELIDDTAVAGLFFDELPRHLKGRFLNYGFQITEIRTDDRDRIIDQFMDLQLGRRLNGQERRQASPGIVRNIVFELADHPFVNFAKINYRRMKKYETVSRLIVWEWNERISETKAATLDRLYIQHAYDDITNGRWREIRSRMIGTFDLLKETFVDYHPGIRTIVTFMQTYWLWRNLKKEYVITSDLISQFPEWFEEFYKHIKTQQHNSLAAPSLQRWAGWSTSLTLNTERYEYMQSQFFSSFPDIAQKDTQRRFTDAQRTAIWARDGGRCQWVQSDGSMCSKRLTWESWHADHIIPHSQGGLTSVDNGRVVCPYRNRSNGGNGQTSICPHAR